MTSFSLAVLLLCVTLVPTKPDAYPKLEASEDRALDLCAGGRKVHVKWQQIPVVTTS
jgi:hypothetical protein